MDQEHFFDIKSATEKYFFKNAKPPIQIKNIRLMVVKKNDPTISVRDTYHGFWRSCVIRNKCRLPDGINLKPAYTDSVKISPLKISNLKTLLGYLRKPENILFYEEVFERNESTQGTCSNVDDIDEDDNSSGCEDA